MPPALSRANLYLTGLRRFLERASSRANLYPTGLRRFLERASSRAKRAGGDRCILNSTELSSQQTLRLRHSGAPLVSDWILFLPDFRYRTLNPI